MKNCMSLIIMMLLPAAFVRAQSIPVIESLGKVSVEECSFTEYPADTTASALVLWEKCDVLIDYDERFQGFRRSKRYAVRYKILKEEGKERANGSIYFYTGNDGREAVERLTVTTYNLVNGKVVATKAPKTNIIRSDYSENTQKIAYTADAVKVGSVVEISYEFYTPEFMDIPDYYLQSDIPVNLSVYSISIPQWMPTNKTARGSHRLEYSSETKQGQNLDGLVYDNSHLQEVYRAVDLPALKDEPMLFCPQQFLDAVSYEVTAIQIPGNYKNFSRNWGNIAEAVGESAIYSQMNARSPFRDEVSAIAGKEEDEIDRITEIVKLVKDNVKWNDKIGLVPSNLPSIAKERTGDSADMNAMIGSALKAAGFNVLPVLVRLRRSGVILEQRPQLSAFNTFILHIVTSDGKDLYLDGADPSCHFNVLPEQYLVSKGFEVLDNHGNFRWVDLTALNQNMTTYLVNASVSGTSLTGEVSGKYTNVSSYDFKDTFRGFNDEEELYDKMEKFIPAELSDMTVTGFDEFSSTSTLNMKFTRECESAGDLLIVNPFLMPLLSDAAFRHETRAFPVDFPYPETISYIVRIAIPEGYVVEQLPKSCIYKSALPSNMSFRAIADAKVVTLQFKFDNRAIISLPEAYPDVRKYWTDVCAIFNERIIFKKAE